MRLNNKIVSGVLAMAALFGGCRGQVSQDAPVVPIRNMHDQPRYDMQSESAFYEDHRTMRTPVPGTVAAEAEIETVLASGILEDETGYAPSIPEESIKHFGTSLRMVNRGQERFNIYCSPCHGRTGAGDGIVVARGMMQPPTFHQDRLRHAPDGQLFATIKNGIRNMPPYAAQLSVFDRWAVVAYVRALQVAATRGGNSQQEEATAMANTGTPQ